MFVAPAPPELSFLARIDVRIGPPIELGAVAGTRRRIIPIEGGSVIGPLLVGAVLPGGADFQSLPNERPQELEARYAIEVEDGTRISIENRGIRSGAPADLARLSAGARVDPALIYFRSTPRLHAPDGRWGWLNTRLFIARGERLPDLVRLEVFVIE